uniref:PPUP8824 n=1 Tax=Poeciliopsis prolifica TaxID=188132 RepID=A0A0S7ERS0_9TELE
MAAPGINRETFSLRVKHLNVAVNILVKLSGFCFFIFALFALQTMSPGSSKERQTNHRRRSRLGRCGDSPRRSCGPEGPAPPPAGLPPPALPAGQRDERQQAEGAERLEVSGGQPDGPAALDRHQAAVRTQETDPHVDFPSYPETATWLVFCLSSHVRNPPATGSQMINKQT